jgi:hypothetical protein
MSSKIALRLASLGAASAPAWALAGWVNAATYDVDGISASPLAALTGTLTGSLSLADLTGTGIPGTFTDAVYQPVLVAFQINDPSQSPSVGPNGDSQYGLGAPDNEAPGMVGAPGDPGAITCGTRSIYDPESETYLGSDGDRHPCP